MLRPSMAAAALALTALLGPNPTAVLAAPVADAPAAKEVAEGPDAASLRAAELAFAASVAAHDPERFASFIADDAIFIGGGALRGRAAIVAAWAGFFADGGPKIEWAPRLVEVQDGGALGLTRGPYTLTPPGADGAAKASSGIFTSIWRREPDGRWRVIFDAGCPPCPQCAAGGG